MTFSKIFLTSVRSSLRLALGVVLLAGLMACEEEGQPVQASGEAARDRYGVLNATFYVDKVGASTTETLGYNSWGFPNKKKFNFRACFKDQLLRGALQNWDVIILDGANQKMVQTDFGGCANWSEVYSFDYFAPESYIEVTRTFNVTGGHSGDVKVVLGVNPWSGSVVDLRYDEIEEVIPNAAGPSTFTATMSTSATEKAVTDQKGITLKYQGHAYNDFEIDHNLSLKVAHYYQVEFNPTIFRRTLAKAKSGEAPQQGLVRVKAILLRDNLENPDLASFDNYITAFEQTFSIYNGGVKQQIILKFPDITAISSRMKALVRVEPIVDSPSVTGANFEGYLGALPGGSFDLVPTEYDVGKIFAEFTSREIQIDKEGLSGVGILAAATGVKAITERQLQDASRSPDCYEGETLEDRDCRFATFARAACENMGLKESGMCLLPALTLSHVGEFVEGWFVENKAPVSLKRRGITHSSETLNFTSGIARGRAFNSAGNFSLGLGLDLGLSVPLMDKGFGGRSPTETDPGKPPVATMGASFGAKLGASQSFSYARSLSRSAAVSSTQSFSLVSQAQEFEINTQARRCLIYTVTDHKEAEEYGMTNVGAFYCDETPREVASVETYYYISGGNVGTNAWTDGESLAENPWLMFVRGSNQMGVFRELVSRKKVNIEISDIVIRRDSSQIPQALYERVNQKFPGMISGEVTILE